MSRSRNSSRRTPASKPSATMSTRRLSTWTSTSTFGWRAMNRGSTGLMTKGTASAGTVIRICPVSSPSRADAALIASSAWLIAGPACSKRRLPAAVSATLRVVRESNVTPSFASSWRTAWLSADGEIPSSDAALAKLRRRATARNSLSALRGVKAIVKVSYIARPLAMTHRAAAPLIEGPHEGEENENHKDVFQVGYLGGCGTGGLRGSGWRCGRESDSDDQRRGAGARRQQARPGINQGDCSALPLRFEHG